MTKDKQHIFIKNIYYMLSYAFSILKQGEYENMAAEEFDNLHNLLAAILSKGISRQLKQGLYREYVSHTENLSTIRGKIDLPGTIQNRISRQTKVSCEYDELSENNLHNQIIKTTVVLLLRHANVEQQYKDVLKQEILFFSCVDLIDPFTIQWSSIRFHRNNRSYRMLISLCQLIIEGLLLTTEQGEQRLAAFFDEQHMCRLYEKFILEYFTAEHKELSASASQIPWALDDGIGTMLPVMQTDVTLKKGNKALIIDAKYYAKTTQTNHNVHTIHSNNLYQIYTYVKNYAASYADQPHTVSGMLLYAATDEEIQPNQIYRMQNNQISVRTLDLNQEFSMIAAQLDAIVGSHFIE